REDLGHRVALAEELRAELPLELLLLGRRRDAVDRLEPVLRDLVRLLVDQPGDGAEQERVRRAVARGVGPETPRREAELQVPLAARVEGRVRDQVQRAAVVDRQR